MQDLSVFLFFAMEENCRVREVCSGTAGIGVARGTGCAGKSFSFGVRLVSSRCTQDKVSFSSQPFSECAAQLCGSISSPIVKVVSSVEIYVLTPHVRFPSTEPPCQGEQPGVVTACVSCRKRL